MTTRWRRSSQAALVLLLGTVGCRGDDTPAAAAPPGRSLTIGFGLSSGADPAGGIRSVARNVTMDPLFAFERDGRPSPVLVDEATSSADGLAWTLRLKPSIAFHDGTMLTASVLRDALLYERNARGGPAFEDVADIQVSSELSLEVALKRRSTFFLEGLDFLISRSADEPVGTGPYRIAERTADGAIALQANRRYFGGAPILDQITIQPYKSVRAAWAELLRGQVDMVYEVGVDALDSLERARGSNVFVFQRNYAYVGIFNTRRPALREPRVRRALNAAIDRDALIAEVFRGHGVAADIPLPPQHWAVDAELPGYRYAPELVQPDGTVPLDFVIADASLERLGLAVQRQLRAVGIDLKVQIVSLDEWRRRAETGAFDVLLADALLGPTLVRPYMFWYTGAIANYGGFSSEAVDLGFEAMRGAADDASYRAGVARLHRALLDDPPALFLTWSQRARAVSTRFDVPTQAGRDILATLPLWRPVAGGARGAADRRERASVH